MRRQIMLLEILLGLLITSILLFDIFQAVLVPRFTPSSFRIAPYITSRIGWPIFKSLACVIKDPIKLDLVLGTFAPLAFVVIFVLWLSSIIFAYGLIIHGLGAEFHPAVNDLPTAIYLSGTSLLTVGFGDIVAVSHLGRAVLLLGAATGITIVAIAVSFLFSMQQSVQKRETLVHSYQSRISPGFCAVSLLANYAALGLKHQLVDAIHDWETWTAHVLTSHRSFPLLCYFRSGHMSVPWLTLMGVFLDTANLLATTVNEERFAHSRFFLRIGSKSVQIFSAYFKLQPIASKMTKDDFVWAYEHLEANGYELYDLETAWDNFRLYHSQYGPALCALAYNFLCPMPCWRPERSGPVAGYGDYGASSSMRQTQEFLIAGK